MTDIEMLAKLVQNVCGCDKDEAMLIAHNLTVKGVTIPVRCLHCKNYMHDDVDDRYWCKRTGEFIEDNDFCSYGERREGE